MSALDWKIQRMNSQRICKRSTNLIWILTRGAGTDQRRNNLNQIKNLFLKTNNKNIITKNQENRNCELPNDNTFIRSNDKNLFKSNINSSNNFNFVSQNYIMMELVMMSLNNTTKWCHVTTPNNTITADVLKNVFIITKKVIAKKVLL